MNCKRQVVLFSLFTALWMYPSATLSQEDLDAVRSNANLRGPFVQTSLKLIEDGANRAKILETLSFVAKRKAKGSFVSLRAVNAVFHIASDNQTIQQYLLDIIEDPATCSTSAREAHRLVVYVLDDSGRKRLRAIARREFPSDGSCYRALQALVEVGDDWALARLEEILIGLPSELAPMRPLLESMAEQIRIQQAPSKLIACLVSDEQDIDRGWIVRQAMRHGTSHEKLHAAVIRYLNKHLEAADAPLVSSLVHACDEYSLISKHDGELFPSVQGVRRIDSLISNEGSIGPWWATLPDAKRAAFYKIPYTPPTLPSTPVPDTAKKPATRP